jgi:hypothetical protein
MEAILMVAVVNSSALFIVEVLREAEGCHLVRGRGRLRTRLPQLMEAWPLNARARQMECRMRRRKRRVGVS